MTSALSTGCWSHTHVQIIKRDYPGDCPPVRIAAARDVGAGVWPADDKVPGGRDEEAGGGADPQQQML